MLKTFNFKGPEDSFWVTSDTHINHNRTFILEPRGYKTIQDHDNDIIHQWNQVVKITDTVFFLGDFYLCSNKAEDSLNVIRRLNFSELWMGWGNHNASVKQLYQEEIKSQYNLENIEIYPLTKTIGNKKIIFYGNDLECYINGQHIIMNHFAMRTWHKNGKGSWCLVGHSHANDKEINEHSLNGKILDCGFDNFKRPINFREIKNIMNKKNINVTDHHCSDC